MAVLDIVILVCLGISLIVGIKRGLISQLVSVAALILGVWCSMKFSMALCGWLGGIFTDATPSLIKTVSFVVIFIIVAIALGILGRLLEKCIKLVMLGWLNRLLGAALAVCTCLLVLGLLSNVFDMLYAHYASAHELTEMPAFISESIFYESIHKIGGWVFPYLGKLSV